MWTRKTLFIEAQNNDICLFSCSVIEGKASWQDRILFLPQVVPVVGRLLQLRSILQPSFRSISLSGRGWIQRAADRTGKKASSELEPSGIEHHQPATRGSLRATTNKAAFLVCPLLPPQGLLLLSLMMILTAVAAGHAVSS